MLLTKKDELPQAVKDFIKMYRVRRTTIIGGSGVVSDGVASQVPEPSRIYGKDRYETSVRIAEHALNKLGFDDSGVYLATGENFPDALSAGVPASLDKNVLLLVSSKLPLKSSTEVFLSNQKQIYKGVVVGGEGAVSQAVVEKAFQLTSTNWAGSIPLEIQGKVISIASGEKHVLALTSDGKVYAWGDNLYGQSSVPLEAKSQVVQIACGTFHSLALKEDGTVVAWGSNLSRQLDIATLGLSDVVKIAAGSGHSVALKSDGRVFVFGDVYINHATGETVYGPNRAVPSVVQGKVIGIACGNSHTLALTEDGFVYGWGNNDYGQAFGPWDYEPEPGAKVEDLSTTFTVEFNVPVSLNLSRIAFRRYDGISVSFNGRVEGNRIYVKPENPLQPNYFYTLFLEKDAVVPAEYSTQLPTAMQLSYSTWRLFAVHGVVYNFAYPWPVFPYIEFFPSAVETTYALYRDSVQVPWTNGSIVREPGNYLLYVWASSNSKEESSVYLNFRLDIRYQRPKERSRIELLKRIVQFFKKNYKYAVLFSFAFILTVFAFGRLTSDSTKPSASDFNSQTSYDEAFCSGECPDACNGACPLESSSVGTNFEKNQATENSSSERPAELPASSSLKTSEKTARSTSSADQSDTRENSQAPAKCPALSQESSCPSY